MRGSALMALKFVVEVMVPTDAWLLAIELARLELRDDLLFSIEEFFDANDFLQDWAHEIRLRKYLDVVF